MRILKVFKVLVDEHFYQDRDGPFSQSAKTFLGQGHTFAFPRLHFSKDQDAFIFEHFFEDQSHFFSGLLF